MEFKGFNNPHEKDYDFNSILNGSKFQYKYYNLLVELINDATKKKLQEENVIFRNEYFRINAEAIAKDTQKLNNDQKSKQR